MTKNVGDITTVNKLSFELTPKSKIEVVGPTVSDKSTLLKTIAVTYCPTERSMDIDGVGISQ